jgi:hypothetical protein
LGLGLDLFIINSGAIDWQAEHSCGAALHASEGLHFGSSQRGKLSISLIFRVVVFILAVLG